MTAARAPALPRSLVSRVRLSRSSQSVSDVHAAARDKGQTIKFNSNAANANVRVRFHFIRLV